VYPWFFRYTPDGVHPEGGNGAWVKYVSAFPCHRRFLVSDGTGVIEGRAPQGDIKLTRRNHPGTEEFRMSAAHVFLFGLRNEHSFTFNGRPAGRISLHRSYHNDLFELNATNAGSVFYDWPPMVSAPLTPREPPG
jgi:hypothetical protein